MCVCVFGGGGRLNRFDGQDVAQMFFEFFMRASVWWA